MSDEGHDESPLTWITLDAWFRSNSALRDEVILTSLLMCVTCLRLFITSSQEALPGGAGDRTALRCWSLLAPPPPAASAVAESALPWSHCWPSSTGGGGGGVSRRRSRPEKWPQRAVARCSFRIEGKSCEGGGGCESKVGAAVDLGRLHIRRLSAARVTSTGLPVLHSCQMVLLPGLQP